MSYLVSNHCGYSGLSQIIKNNNFIQISNKCSNFINSKSVVVKVGATVPEKAVNLSGTLVLLETKKVEGM